MTDADAPATTRRSLRGSLREQRSRSTSRVLIAVAAVAIVACIAIPLLAQLQGREASTVALDEYVAENAQSFVAADAAAPVPVARESFSATPGVETLVAGGTNHDWAKLVLLLGGFPMTEQNVTVITRWMRQENYIDSWWNRNNPLNNGWGSGGGSGLGSYDSLVTAAENAAEALRENSGYAGIVEALDASAPTEVTEAAIWASPWASSHYNNGAHWSYEPVPVIEAPADAW